MALPRSIGSTVLAIGLVTIPVRVYSATKEERVSLRRLERSTGAPVKQPTVSSVSGEPLASEQIVSGLEIAPDAFVTFEAPELEALDREADERIRIRHVVHAAAFDPTHKTKSVFIGPDKGGDRAYHLLASLLAHRGQVAIGQWGSRMRDELVVVAPHLSGEGLVVHTVLYPDEVRLGVLSEAVPAGVPLSPLELELGGRLLDSLLAVSSSGGTWRGSFLEALELPDGAAARLRAAAERKVAGGEIVIPPPRETVGPHDLIEQLRASVPTPIGRPVAAKKRPARSVRAS